MKKEKIGNEQAEKDGQVLNYIEDLENRLTKAFGRRVKIIDGKRRGRIEFEYYDREDFERLFGLLSSIKY